MGDTGDQLEKPPDGGNGEDEADAPEQALLKDGALEFVCLFFEVEASYCDHGNERNRWENCYQNSEWMARVIVSEDVCRKE